MSTMSPTDPAGLPDVNGIQAVSEARPHKPHLVLLNFGLPVIVVMGRDSEVAEQTVWE